MRHRTGLAMALAASLCIVGAIRASAVAGAPPDELDQARDAYAAATAPSARRAALEQLLEVRAGLLHQRGDDPEAVFWALDQAADLVFELFPLGGDDLVLFTGMPTEDQLARAERIAEEAPRRLEFAERRLDDAIRRLEDDPDYADDADLQARRTRLALEEKDLRIPLMRGLSAAIGAECRAARGMASGAAAREVAVRLEPLEARLAGAMRPLTLWMRAAALLHVGRADEALTLLERAEADPEALDADRFASRVVRVRAIAKRDGAAAALEALDTVDEAYRGASDLFYRFLIADRRCALRLRQAAETPAADRGPAVRRALDAYLELDGAAGVSPDTLHELILERLRQAPLEGVPLEALPAVVTLARAQTLALDPARCAEALSLLDAALARRGLTGAERAALEFERAETLQRAGRDLDAAEAYADIGSGDPRAEEAIERAARLAAAAVGPGSDDADRALLRNILERLLEDHPNLPTADRWRCERARLDLDAERYEAAMQRLDRVPDDSPMAGDARYLAAVAVSRAVDDAGFDAPTALREQAVQAARRAAESAAANVDPDRRADMIFYESLARVLEAEAEFGLGDARASIAALDALPAGGIDDDAVLIRATRTRVAALRELGDARGIDEALGTIVERTGQRAGAVLDGVLIETIDAVQTLVREDRDPDRVAILRRGLVPLARRMDSWLQAGGRATVSARRDALLRRAADGYRIGGASADALRLYDELLARRPDVAEVLFGRAEALFDLGGEECWAEAMAVYRRLARATGADDDLYWVTQLRVLQILDQVGRHTDQIRPRIDRLRLEDPRFGGPPWERQFGVLEMKY